MTVNIPRIPAGARVRVRRGTAPIEADLLGRSGSVIEASEYQVEKLGVVLDGEDEVRMFAPEELEVLQEDLLPPERQQAKLRRALP